MMKFKINEQSVFPLVYVQLRQQRAWKLHQYNLFLRYMYVLCDHVHLAQILNSLNFAVRISNGKVISHGIIKIFNT